MAKYIANLRVFNPSLHSFGTNESEHGSWLRWLFVFQISGAPTAVRHCEVSFDLFVPSLHKRLSNWPDWLLASARVDNDTVQYGIY